MNDLVTIIVPVYKCEKYIRKCIESIIAQTYASIELILVLDGIFDNSDKICRKYAQSDKRIRVIEQQNQGVSIARNTGMKASVGDWVVFVDGDDWLEQDFISKMLSYADGSVDIAICDYYAEYSNESKCEKFFNYDDYIFQHEEMSAIMWNCLIPIGCGNTGSCTNVGVPWAKIYRSSFLRDNHLKFKPGLSRMQDMVFNLYAFSAAKKVIYKSIPLYHYNKNDGASTIAFRPMFNDTVRDINNAVREFVEYSGEKEILNIMYCKNIMLLLEIVKLQFVMDRTKKIHKKFDEIRDILREDSMNLSLKKYDPRYLNFKSKIAGFLLKHKMVELVYLYVYIKTYKKLRYIRK